MDGSPAVAGGPLSRAAGYASVSLAAAASRSISAVSALSSFCSSFSARFIACSTLAPMSATADHDQPGRAGVEALAELLEVVAAHPRRGVTGDRAEDGAAARRGRQQAAPDGREREQRDDEAGGEPDATAEHAAHARRRLVLLDDLDLAVVATLDDGGVVGVDQARLRVKVMHELVVGLRVLDVVIDADERHQRVDCHRAIPLCWATGMPCSATDG